MTTPPVPDSTLPAPPNPGMPSPDTARAAVPQAEANIHANATAWQALLGDFAASASRVRLGGGAVATERQHAKGRLSARERLLLLIDGGSAFDELMLYAGDGMYPDEGGCPAGGVVTGVAQVAGRPWMVIANDATVKAGAFFPITAKKVIRAQTIALENHLPVIYLVDSAGAYLPLADEVFPDQDDFGRIFYLNARLSAQGTPQIAAIVGMCVAGGAYLPVMCDTLIMSQGSGLYLAGTSLVKAAIGQVVDAEELGGAQMHAEVAGTVDYLEKDDAAAIARVRRLAALHAHKDLAPWARGRQPSVPPAKDPQDLYSLVSPASTQPYEVRELLERIFDGGTFEEYKADYGQAIVCGLARLGGFPVGIVANQRTIIKKKLKASGVPGLAKRIEIGGVIYGDSADKAARFILDANQMGVPLIFFSDVTGFMVGRDSEQEGIIRRGAKMVNAVSNSVVPRLTVVTGGSYGAGNYAMSGKAFAPRFLYLWPSAKHALMSGNSAAKTLMDVRVQQHKKLGQRLDEEDLKALHTEITEKYAQELDPRFSASRLWADEIIVPTETRERLIRSLEVCALNSRQEELKIGVFQV